MWDGATLFDFAVIGLLVVSTIIGLARGAIREILSIIAFLAGAIVAFKGTPVIVEGLDNLLPGGSWVAYLVSILGLFTLVFFAISIVTSNVEKAVRRHGAYGGIDRLLGAVFGILRAALIAGIGLLFLQAAVPSDGLPTQARTYPVVEHVAALIASVADPSSAIGKAGRKATTMLPDARP
jgi:membrane protein required for colicin V production